jgi:sensor c-di-GMP phosphodiesterase-like protein
MYKIKDYYVTDYKLTPKDISNAIKNDEFLFFYQPILSLRSGKIDSAEALIRWKKDNGELVQACHFILQRHGPRKIRSYIIEAY